MHACNSHFDDHKGRYRPHARWCPLTMMLLSLWWQQRMIYPHARWCVHTLSYGIWSSSTFSTRDNLQLNMCSFLLAYMAPMTASMPAMLQIRVAHLPLPPTFFMARPLVLLDRSVASSVPMPSVLVHHIYESYQQEPTSTTLVWLVLLHHVMWISISLMSPTLLITLSVISIAYERIKMPKSRCKLG